MLLGCSFSSRKKAMGILKMQYLVFFLNLNLKYFPLLVLAAALLFFFKDHDSVF